MIDLAGRGGISPSNCLACAVGPELPAARNSTVLFGRCGRNTLALYRKWRGAELPEHGDGAGAASLSIEPFEVSRWRLRRTRQPPVCVFNRVLVLKRYVAGGLNETPNRHSATFGRVIFPPREDTARMSAVTAFAPTHLYRPGAPARMASQERKVTKSCPVHVAGCSGNELTRGVG